MMAQEIYERIQRALKLSYRRDKVSIVAVSKTRTITEMQKFEAIPYIEYFGENRVQECLAKRKAYGTSSKLWRLIGHLQGNKVRQAIEIFDSIDSIDSIELALRVDRIAGELGRTMPILIEVKTTHEPSKTGIAPENLVELLDSVMSLTNLRLQGLMTIGPLNGSESEIRHSFSLLRQLSETSRQRTGLALPILSMGMSGDFELAISEGSTMVRLGTLLFGERDRKNL